VRNKLLVANCMSGIYYKVQFSYLKNSGHISMHSGENQSMALLIISYALMELDRYIIPAFAVAESASHGDGLKTFHFPQKIPC
jgi:hypothetical protein